MVFVCDTILMNMAGCLDTLYATTHLVKEGITEIERLKTKELATRRRKYQRRTSKKMAATSMEPKKIKTPKPKIEAKEIGEDGACAAKKFDFNVNVIEAVKPQPLSRYKLKKQVSCIHIYYCYNTMLLCM